MQHSHSLTVLFKGIKYTDQSINQWKLDQSRNQKRSATLEVPWSLMTDRPCQTLTRRQVGYREQQGEKAR